MLPSKQFLLPVFLTADVGGEKESCVLSRFAELF